MSYDDEFMELHLDRFELKILKDKVRKIIKLG